MTPEAANPPGHLSGLALKALASATKPIMIEEVEEALLAEYEDLDLWALETEMASLLAEGIVVLSSDRRCLSIRADDEGLRDAIQALSAHPQSMKH